MKQYRITIRGKTTVVLRRIIKVNYFSLNAFGVTPNLDLKTVEKYAGDEKPT